MTALASVLAALVAFATAVVGVVTGGNSLVTVPALLALGMPSRQAVATNMFAVTFLALSGWIRFARSGRIRWDVTTPLVGITLVTSWLGARLVSTLSEPVVRAIVAGSLVVMLGVIALRPRFGEGPARSVSRARYATGMAIAAVLGVYGGLFSGGYTTLLTFTCVGLLGTSLGEAVGLTKVVNFASSAIASVEFARQGLIDWRLAAPLSLAMIGGAWIGAGLAVRLGHRFMRAVFVTALVGLSLKLVIWDLILRR